MSESLQPGESAHLQEVRPEIRQTIDFADRVLVGMPLRAFKTNELGFAVDDPDSDPLDPAEIFSGPILDENDPALTLKEKDLLTGWIKDKLGTEEDQWYLSRWLNEGEEPSWVMWQEEVYAWQLGAEYSEYIELQPFDKR